MQEILKVFLQEKGKWYRQNTDLHKERKSITEGTNESNIKILFLTGLKDNSLFKAIIVTVVITISWWLLHKDNWNESDVTGISGKSWEYFYKVTVLPVRQLVLFEGGVRLNMYVANFRPTSKKK